MRVQVIVRLKHGVLDPQEAVHRALAGLGHDQVRGVRVCKLIELDVEEGPVDEVRAAVATMADQLLANPVIESFSVGLPGDDDFHEVTDPYASGLAGAAEGSKA